MPMTPVVAYVLIGCGVVLGFALGVLFEAVRAARYRANRSAERWLATRRAHG